MLSEFRSDSAILSLTPLFCHAQITQRNAPAPTIEHGAERAEQKGQSITSFARQKRNDFRRGFEPQPLQTVANLSRRAHRSSVSARRVGCERLTRNGLSCSRGAVTPAGRRRSTVA